MSGFSLQHHLLSLVDQLLSEDLTILGYHILFLAAAVHLSPLPETLVIWSSVLYVKVTLHSAERADSIDRLCYLGSCYFQGVEHSWEVATSID